MNDLEFIRKHVKTWPKGAETVRLDHDGEICFTPDASFDFFPHGYNKSMFNAEEGRSAVGVQYAHEQWSDGRDLTALDVPFGELDRDTQLRLANHVLDGGIIEKHTDNRWRITNGHDRKLLCFCNSVKYRAVAKQPTERETLEAKLHEQWLEINETMRRIMETK